MQGSRQIGVQNAATGRCGEITTQDWGAQGGDHQIDTALRALSPLINKLHDLLKQHTAEWLELSQAERVEAVVRVLNTEL